ncbi:DUF2316 family protein [Furfurilactobacillus siliginis]|uniref:DUF2316 domain-containing protein n=1 Tax=Furfurilactobacillus siliginis TaxID=348151 RepID=A0A0R2L3V9_9LACO|nr:DUF2316 family protein [Furfurilactobacillus siliginis]KRN96339.1 hypothetical protein IV55_GL001301 [Furfurilactobacillus siliginis]GEK29344.1 hypothetical protein LSI01_16550 [Furfurilactobacillus siliginis]
MTLNPAQRAATQREFRANFQRAGLTVAQVAIDLGISEIKLEHMLNLTQLTYEDVWILRNYVLDKVQAAGQVPVPFTALAGDWHQYWFLNSTVIDERRLSAGDL